ncbi:MAG: discoidin domain-containing protein [Actinomycetota bacterium]
MRTQRFRIAVVLALLIGAALVPATTVGATGDADGDGIPDTNDTVTNIGSIVSQGQPTSQSDTIGNNFARFGPALAVDGNTGGRYPTDIMAITRSADSSPSFSPWWEVDLGRVHTVDGVNIYARIGCCSTRLDGAEIFVGAESFGVQPIEEVRRNAVWSTTIAGNRDLYQIDVPTRLGRYVRIHMASGITGRLDLAEVQVIGTAGRPNDADGDLIVDREDTVATSAPIVSTGQPATQSSVWSGGSGADAAVDDRRDGGRDGSQPVAITDDDEPWWEVDLGHLHAIDGINLYNRTDSGQQLLAGATVMVGAQPFGNVGHAEAVAAAVWTTALPTPASAVMQLDLDGEVGRYVRVQLPPDGGRHLGLIEVDVIAGPVLGDADGDGIPDGADAMVTGNIVSTGHVASQSHTLNDDFVTFGPANAVDGATGRFYPQHRLAISRMQNNSTAFSPWWEVDLTETHTIDSVNIHYRNYGTHRLDGAELLIGDAPFGDISIDEARDQALWSMPIDGLLDIYQLDVPAIDGRYVRIHVPPNLSGRLDLAEVQVSGTPTEENS